MTLQADRSPDFQMPEAPLPLILRPGRRPRLPLWYWLRYPNRARWISLLIREAFHWKDKPKLEPDALTYAEAAVLRRTQRELRAKVDATVEKIDQLAGRFHVLQRQAGRDRRAAARVREQPIVVKSGGSIFAVGSMSVSQAKTIVNRCRHRIEEDTRQGQTRHLDRFSASWAKLAIIPLVVDVVALFTVILKIFNITSIAQAAAKPAETIAAAGFAVIASLVLFVLSHSAGKDAWQLRAVTGGQTDVSDEDEEPSDGAGRGCEFPQPLLVLKVKLISMSAVSFLVASSIAIRVIQPSPDKPTTVLGWTIGLTLGLVVFLAPWAIVYMHLKYGSLEVQAIKELTEAIGEAEKDAAACDKAAEDAEAEAEGLRQEAERVQRSGVRAAMDLTDDSRQIIDLARSAHGQAGPLATSDSVRPAEGSLLYVTDLLSATTDSIAEALKGFGSPEEQS
ncbi:hypothetical protein PV646_28385 [Streptomyces sp. ID05-26A]|nr:hypothetical protein [Streptomyces sp. ID05-26A]